MMTVGDVLKYNEGLDVIVEVIWKGVSKPFGYDMDTYFIRSSAHDDLSEHSDRVIKYIRCRKELAPMYRLADTLYGTSTKTPLRVIQCYT